MVTKVWVNHDTDLMNLTIHANGKTSIIHSTQHHPFWNATRHAWIEADQLKPSEQLHTTNGTTATVASTTTIPGAADMSDLTITTTHNFHIATTTAKILVHNCPSGPASPKNFETPTYPPQAAPAQSDLPPEFTVRIMGPTAEYPTGYWRVMNAEGHYVDPSTMQQVGNVSKAQFNAMTHVPLP